MKQLDFWIFIYNKLNKKLKVNLVIVADTHPDFQITTSKMAVSEDVDTFGALGSKNNELSILQSLRGTLTKEEPTNILKEIEDTQNPQDTRNTKTLIVKTLCKDDRDTIKLIIDNLEEQKNGILHITQYTFSFFPECENNDDVIISRNKNDDWKFEENIGVLNTIYIVGGNSLGLALSKVISGLDFFVVIFDEISDLITMKNNHFCNKKIITKYSEIHKYILPSKKSYIIINTPSIEKNKIALKSISDINFKYIGLIDGNTFKEKKKIYDLEVFNKTNQTIHYPAGININPKTPGETAISIISEIISVKNQS
ncbi:MAG: hypothetical protein CR986_04925 [Ignavibacteriae bacterium]|nr:MAG: hypothetical protein CR986_04925 [Ignavibacteriota bacterium]